MSDRRFYASLLAALFAFTLVMGTIMEAIK